MKLKELKKKISDMTSEELKGKLKESKEELFHFRFQLATGHLEDTSKLRQVKKTVARVKTRIRTAELAPVHTTNKTLGVTPHVDQRVERRKKSNAGTRQKKD